MQKRLFTAISEGDATGVQVCLENGADPNKIVLEQKNERLQQFTPLLLACRAEMSDVDRAVIIGKLLAAGADPALVVTAAVPVPNRRPSAEIHNYYDVNDYNETMQSWYEHPMHEVIAPVPVGLEALFAGHHGAFKQILKSCSKAAKRTLLQHSVEHGDSTYGVLDMACMSPEGLKLVLDHDVAADSLTMPLTDLGRLSPESKQVISSARRRQSIRRILSLDMRRPEPVKAPQHQIAGSVHLGTTRGEMDVFFKDAAGNSIPLKRPDLVPKLGSNGGNAKVVHTANGLQVAELEVEESSPVGF